MSKFLGISTSGFYSYINRSESEQSKRKKEVKEHITEIYNQSNQIYGAPKIAHLLRTKGHIIAEKTVGNYMRELGIRAIWVSPYKRTTIDPDFDTKLKNILNRNFNPKTPNTVWVTDITYIYILSGFVYLALIMDLYSRTIAGWHLTDNLSTASVLRVIEKAKANRKLESPIIIHSDRGTQYVSKAYIEATPASEFIRSYSKRGILGTMQ